MVQKRKGIGEEGTVTGRKGGNKALDTWMGCGRPRGGTDIPPEFVFGGESA